MDKKVIQEDLQSLGFTLNLVKPEMEKGGCETKGQLIKWQSEMSQNYS